MEEERLARKAYNKKLDDMCRNDPNCFIKIPDSPSSSEYEDIEIEGEEGVEIKKVKKVKPIKVNEPFSPKLTKRTALELYMWNLPPKLKKQFQKKKKGKGKGKGKKKKKKSKSVNVDDKADDQHNVDANVKAEEIEIKTIPVS